jgi:hypothetical protein
LFPPQLSEGSSITARNTKIIGVPGGANFVGKLSNSPICEIISTLEVIPNRPLAKGWMVDQVPLSKKGKV